MSREHTHTCVNGKLSFDTGRNISACTCTYILPYYVVGQFNLYDTPVEFTAVDSTVHVP